MKKIYLLLCLIFLSLSSMPVKAETNEMCIEGVTRYKDSENKYLYCYYNTCTQKAIIVQRDVASKPYYDIEELIIPRTFSYKLAVIGEQGSSDGLHVFDVVEIGAGALKNCTAKSISFNLPSNIEIIREGALSQMPNMTGDITLPDGLTLVENEGIYTGFTSITFPTTIDSLGVSSILLENVTTITFESAIPPHCGVDGSLTPWNKDGVETPRDAQIIIPDGSYNAYLNTPGIGDYFTYFTGVQPTDISEMIVNKKEGIYSITGTYLGTDQSQLPKGMYIINGKKVVK